MPIDVRTLVVFCGAVLSAAAVRAEDAPDVVLEAFIREALEHDPAIRAAAAEAEAARARPEQAAARPAPMVSVAYTNDGWSPSLGTQEMTTLAVMWTQALPGPGRRRLRGDVAGAEARSVEQRIERVRLSTIGAVRRAYYGLLLARDLRALLGEQEKLWREVEESARSRYSVGLGTQYDVLRAQLEVTRLQESVLEQEADLVVRAAALNRLAGRPLDAPVVTEAALALRPLSLSFEELMAEGERISPELKAAAAGIEGAQAGIALAQKERRPEATLQAGYMNRGGLDPMWQAGLAVSLPRARKAASAVAEASAGARAAAERRQAVVLDLRLRTHERLTRAQAVEKIAELYTEGIVPQGRAALESALASYPVGKLPFVTVIEALTRVYSDRAAYLRHVAHHESLRAAIDEWGLEATSDTDSAPMARPAGGAAMAASAGSAGEGGTAARSGGGGGAAMSMSR